MACGICNHNTSAKLLLIFVQILFGKIPENPKILQILPGIFYVDPPLKSDRSKSGLNKLLYLFPAIFSIR